MYCTMLYLLFVRGVTMEQISVLSTAEERKESENKNA